MHAHLPLWREMEDLLALIEVCCIGAGIVG